ncbi:short chain aldehyde dehydrogenase 1-like [Typha latifolia]|uniref:short chain aldehyde dehydrogenase 1-like n=1 Tax=Typha latifolia TaxID=4733 RepID=UPI003C306616
MATATFTKRLEGKVALITGGAAGAGEATARLFVQHGAKVVLLDINDDLGRHVAADIGPDDVIAYMHGDVSVEADVSDAVDLTVAKYGGLDIQQRRRRRPKKGQPPEDHREPRVGLRARTRG